MTLKKIESKARKFLFARYSPILRDQVLVAVEAYDKDHAILTLLAEYPHIEKMDWDYLDELEPSHFLGVLGRDIPLMEKPLLAHIIGKIFQ